MTLTDPDPNWHLETPRLYISYPQSSLDAHCDFLVTLYNTPLFIQHALGGKPTSITTRDAARKHIATRFAAWHARNGYGQYLISLKPSSPSASESEPRIPADAPFPERLARCKPIGTVSLMRGDPDGPTAHAVPDLGFAIVPEETRKGYAREAARALVEYALRELGLRAVLGITDPANAAAMAVFRSMGFEDRGTRALAEFGGQVSAVWVSPGGRRICQCTICESAREPPYRRVVDALECCESTYLM
ncbi:acyl-CoA N-acyltransferase [Daedaleopsis nitida]|nr:acyl-CoA N-acyltransferase [Daedaleopsis nitida]